MSEKPNTEEILEKLSELDMFTTDTETYQQYSNFRVIPDHWSDNYY